MLYGSDISGRTRSRIPLPILQCSYRRNFRYLTIERLDRELTVRIRLRFPVMPRYGVDDFGHEAVSPPERLEAMSPSRSERLERP